MWQENDLRNIMLTSERRKTKKIKQKSYARMHTRVVTHRPRHYVARTTVNVSTCAAPPFSSLPSPPQPRSRLLSVWLIRPEDTGQFMPNYVLITIIARLKHRWCMELSNCRDPQLHTIVSIVSLSNTKVSVLEHQIFNIKCSKTLVMLL